MRHARAWRRPAVLSWVLATLALPAGAGVLIVDAAGGSGAGFTTIQPAVDAALEGDTVLVREGSYFALVVISGKSLSLVADGDVHVTAFSFSTWGIPTIQVRNLTLGQQVLVRGFELESGVSVTNCDGAVWFDELEVIGRAICYDGGIEGAYVQGSRRVTFTRCSLVGQNSRRQDVFYSPAQPGVSAVSASVALHDCEIRGGYGENAFLVYPAEPGGPGLKVSKSTVTVVGCTIVGGAGGAGPQPICSTTGAVGGPGVELVHSLLGGPAVVRSTASTVAGGVLSLEPMCPGQTGPPGPAITGTGTIVTLPGVAHHLRAKAPVRAGETLEFELEGLAGEIPLLLVSLDHDPQFLPALGGYLLVGLPPAEAIVLDPLPASGHASLAFAVPGPGALASLTCYAQAVFLDPRPRIWMGAGTSLVLLAPGF